MTVVSIYYWLSLREFTLAPCYFKLLDRCSGCSTSYTLFFGVRIYISSLWPWLCHNIFNVVRIALLFLPLSLFFFFFSSFTSAYLGCSSLIRCFAVALDVSGCSRCCAVDQCWLLLRYETVHCEILWSVPEIDTNPFHDRHLRNWKYRCGSITGTK